MDVILRSGCGDGVVPIKSFLAGRTFDGHAINTMSLAFDGVCEDLGLVKTVDDPATRLVAEKIIEITARGVHDSGVLRLLTLRELRN